MKKVFYSELLWDYCQCIIRLLLWKDIIIFFHFPVVPLGFLKLGWVRMCVKGGQEVGSVSMLKVMAFSQCVLASSFKNSWV